MIYTSACRRVLGNIPLDSRTSKYLDCLRALEVILNQFPRTLNREQRSVVKERVEAERSKLADGFEPLRDDSFSLTLFTNRMVATAKETNERKGHYSSSQFIGTLDY